MSHAKLLTVKSLLPSPHDRLVHACIELCRMLISVQASLSVSLSCLPPHNP